MVSITDAIIPIFTFDTIYCIGSIAGVLSDTSNNGIIGTWSETHINTDGIGEKVYVFTPDYNQCAIPISKTIRVSSPGVVINQPESQVNLCENLSDIYLNVEVYTEEILTLTYQWYHNGLPISGATDSIYYTPFTLDKIGKYYVVVKGCCNEIISAEVDVKESSLYVEQKWDDVLAVNNVTDEYVSYQWYRNGVAIEREGNSQYYTDLYGLNGDYHVIAIRADGTLIQSCPVHFNRTMLFSIKVYPNPANTGQSVYVDITGNDNGEYEIEIYDVTGRSVHRQKGTGNRATINNRMNIGAYVIKIVTSMGVKTTPLIIQN